MLQALHNALRKFQKSHDCICLESSPEMKEKKKMKNVDFTIKLIYHSSFTKSFVQGNLIKERSVMNI